MTLLKTKNKAPKKAKVNGGGGTKQFLSKLSGAFMLPISVMAIAGLFLGVGAAINSHADHIVALEKFGLFIKNMGDPVFGAMPILFAAAIVVAFTDEAGVAVFAVIIGYLIFSALQTPFITDHMENGKAVVAYHDADGNAVNAKDILFNAGKSQALAMASVASTNLGIASMQTSVFGGIAVGAVVAKLYNKFHTIALPQFISFFGGKRFVSLVTILAMIPLSVIFLLIWPWIGRGLSIFGNALNSVPYGFESFIFGIVERSLIPFGLHHVFYAPLWWTEAGGNVTQDLSQFLTDAGPTGAHAAITKQTADLFKNFSAVGDQSTWMAVNGLSSDTITFTHKYTSLVTGHVFAANETVKMFPFFQDEFGMKLGKFLQGKFPFMIFALPAAAAAMVMAAPKENRKMAMGTIFPAALTSFVTGVTEPIEFTFLFLAPALFWGFHAFMAGISFLIMNVVNAHIGMTFSGGFLDLMIYGALPFGKGTGFWWVFVIGPAMMPIYYAVFYWSIKRFNLETPGRGNNTKLFSKADFKAKQAGSRNGLKPQSAAIVKAYGGWDNITGFTNCATRLRYDVKDGSLVDTAALKAAGAMGVTKVSDTHFQAIMGPQAEQINVNIKGNKGADLGTSAAAPVAAAKAPVKTKSAVTTVKAVSAGTVKPLESMDNGSFAFMGKGVAISPTSKTAKAQKYYAPFAGEVSLVFPTKHAYGIKAANGVEVLIHIGVDTVKLDGKGFKALVKQGDKVKAGQIIAEADLSVISKKVPSVDTAVVVTSGQAIVSPLKGKATKASTIFKTK